MCSGIILNMSGCPGALSISAMMGRQESRSFALTRHALPGRWLHDAAMTRQVRAEGIQAVGPRSLALCKSAVWLAGRGRLGQQHRHGGVLLAADAGRDRQVGVQLRLWRAHHVLARHPGPALPLCLLAHGT